MTAALAAKRPLPTMLLFALNGAAFGSWAARIPDVGARVGAGSAALGTALLCVSIGALVSMRLAGRWCARFGSGPVSVVSAGLVCLALVPPGLCTGLVPLCVSLLLFGAATGAANVAANSLGVGLGKALGRPLMPTLHAGFSFGGLAGALVSGLVSGFLPVPAHFALVAFAGLLLVAVLRPALLRAVPSGEPVATEVGSQVPTALIVLLGAIAGCTAFAEGAVSDWGALHLRVDLHAGSTLAACGYAAFSLAMACGRLVGARLVMRWGDTRVLVTGALAAAAGVAVAASTANLALALIGFVLVGLGLANLFPLVIGRAGLLRGSRGVALASTVGYSGLLGGPPLIGFLAARVGLPVAFSGISMLAVLAALLSLAAAVELKGTLTVAAVLRARATDLSLLLEPETARDEPESVRAAKWSRLERRVKRAVFAGVGQLMPFVAVGGLLQAFALLTSHGPAWLHHAGALSAQLGTLAFGLLAPVLAGYIAAALAGRPALMPGLTAGLAAAAAGAGFFGGLVGGVLAGLTVHALRRVATSSSGPGSSTGPLSSSGPGDSTGLGSSTGLGAIGVPAVATIVAGGSMLALIGPPLALATRALTDRLESLDGSSAILLGALLGAMTAADLGGPINKIAYSFAVAGLAVPTGLAPPGTTLDLQPMAAVMAAGMAVPLGLAAATRLRPSLFTPAERRHAATATALGALFVTEGAIPYAVRDPLRVLPAGVLGGASAGATTMALHVTLDAPHGGVLALFAVGHVGVFLAALALGAGVTAVAVTCAKQTLMKPTGRLQPQWAGGAE